MTVNEDTQWINSLKVGDEVAFRRGFGRELVITKVIKITPTGKIRVADTDCLFDERGCAKFDKWTYYHLEPVTPEIRAAVKRKRMLQQISATKFHTLSDSKLESIIEIINVDGMGEA